MSRELTPAGRLAALRPRPMTAAQVADLVERTRAADAAAGTTPEAHAAMVRGELPLTSLHASATGA